MMIRCLRSIWEIGKIINQKPTKNVTKIQLMMTRCLRSNSKKGKRKIHKKCHKNPVDDDPVPEVQLSSRGLEHHLAATCTHKTRFAIMSKRIYETLQTYVGTSAGLLFSDSQTYGCPVYHDCSFVYIVQRVGGAQPVLMSINLVIYFPTIILM